MKVSVVIPTKNPGLIFRSVLPAVLAQKTSFPFDVLVVDSGSTDGTVEYVNACTNHRLRLHRIPPTAFGHGRTRNLAVSMTDGEYVAMITHDALPENEHWLTRLVEVADSDPAIAGVFGRHIAYPEADPYTKRDLARHFQNFAHEPIVHLADVARFKADAGYRQYLHFFSDNNALIRRSVWASLPYPDVDFAEDQLWAQRVIEAGWKKAYAHDACVFHSHDFHAMELLRRSFDESHALYRLFGYVLVPSLKHLIGTWLRCSWADLRYGWRCNVWKQDIRAILVRPVDNLLRSCGHFLGSRPHRISPKMRLWLSRDKRLMGALNQSDRTEG
ncbi:family 2 glycosyl transferase [Bordetella bronchialis]|uniref:Family 2 glycosyl transferase n=2 Tax=Bordetella bronchialis TaxID=463025 RepID=A0A193G4Z3_9BORD|nr:family 2 glycosyl transferase [Bordetella bronchialis]ANN75062.1 family 2 glycosyl transferase [Bordetella bronchialis]